MHNTASQGIRHDKERLLSGASLSRLDIDSLRFLELPAIVKAVVCLKIGLALARHNITLGSRGRIEHASFSSLSYVSFSSLSYVVMLASALGFLPFLRRFLIFSVEEPS